MDSVCYGGKEIGNCDRPGIMDDLWNRFVPRPLNPYLNSTYMLFLCPDDTGIWPDPGNTNNSNCYGWSGTSYTFNSSGPSWTWNNYDWSLTAQEAGIGLSGIGFDQIRNPAQTAMFVDAGMEEMNDLPVPPSPMWHNGIGNVALADGLVQQMNLTTLMETTNC